MGKVSFFMNINELNIIFIITLYRCIRSEDGWEFQAIREAVDSSSINGCIPTMNAFLPEANIPLGKLAGHKLYLRTHDPLAKVSLRITIFY